MKKDKINTNCDDFFYIYLLLYENARVGTLYHMRQEKYTNKRMLKTSTQNQIKYEKY